jgi:hypothetical protein
LIDCHPRGGQFVLHAKALHGNPYDGHTLGPVIADVEKLTGVAVRRIYGDKGYRGHNYLDRFKVWISDHARRVTQVIRREMRRRAAVEPVIGHLKDDHRMRATISRAAKATASTPCSPPPASTSVCCRAGSGAYCAPCCGSLLAPSWLPASPKIAFGNILHGRRSALFAAGQLTFWR